MFENSKMRILIKKRHGWLLVVGAAIFLSAIGIAFVGASFTKQDAIQIEVVKNFVELLGFIGFYVFVLGMLLVVFSPRRQDRNTFLNYHKYMVAGFSIASLSILFIPPILNLWEIGKILSWVGGGIMVIGILKVRQA